VHYTPTYSSWINQVERWMVRVFGPKTLLRRSDRRSVHALENDIRTWVKAWNENPLDQARGTDPLNDFYDELAAQNPRRHDVSSLGR
jgi:hypothetical protein